MTIKDKAGQAVAPGYRPIAPAKQAQFQHLQALEDAIDFRQARTVETCTDCGPDDESKCDEHACDLLLIAAYQRAASEVISALEAEILKSRPVKADR